MDERSKQERARFKEMQTCRHAYNIPIHHFVENEFDASFVSPSI